MNIYLARDLTLNLMYEHKLEGWTFEFDNAVRRFGCCDSYSKKITLSMELVKLNSEKQVRDTILHEIAHALAPTWEHHGKEWKRIAKAIGCNGERCYKRAEVVMPKSKYTASCKNCGYSCQVNRNSGCACHVCCNKYNKGKWSKKYKLKYTRNT